MAQWQLSSCTDTLQLQYTRGPLRIASWAHLTNAHLLPGPSIVPTLHAAAQAHLISLNQSVSTEISAGPPLPEDTDHDDEGEGDSSTPPSSSHTTVTTATTTSRDFANERNPMTTEATTTQPPLPAPGPAASSQSDSNDINEDTSDHMLRTHRRNRSGSAFATTTITQSSEPLSPHKPPPSLMKTLSQNEEEDEEPAGEVPSSSSSLSSARNDGIHISGTATTKPLSSQASYIPSTHLLKDLGPPPHARGLLLLAQMSSEGNLATTSYTQACVSTAQANRDFVLGFISQRSLNSAEADNFLCMAPGVSLPSEAEEREREAAAATAATPIKGDGLGQQWRDPKEVVGRDGIDVVIVGRGILSAEDRGREAERYRRKAWEAYEARIGRRGRLAD